LVTGWTRTGWPCTGAVSAAFATLSAMTRLPQHWACGVDLVGPSNLVTFARRRAALLDGQNDEALGGRPGL